MRRGVASFYRWRGGMEATQSFACLHALSQWSKGTSVWELFLDEAWSPPPLHVAQEPTYEGVAERHWWVVGRSQGSAAPWPGPPATAFSWWTLKWAWVALQSERCLDALIWWTFSIYSFAQISIRKRLLMYSPMYLCMSCKIIISIYLWNLVNGKCVCV
jgi:hypothetical protein